MRRVLTLAAVLSVLLPAVSAAQVASRSIELPAPAAGPAAASAVPAVPATAPVVEAPTSVTAAGQQALVQVRAEAAAGRGAPGMQRGKSFGEGEALMIVGGAAFVAGLLLDGDVGTFVSLVGLGVGLYGLYLYLR
ncbi:MAG: hypothetical protein MUF53_04235 [Gemmatimonadaceae bacterium]|jgi:hypothetical protein|nr:hypothetical protein [Gemmatimonadaceae bacterium]